MIIGLSSQNFFDNPVFDENKSASYSAKTPFHKNKTAFCSVQNAVLFVECFVFEDCNLYLDFNLFTIAMRYPKTMNAPGAKTNTNMPSASPMNL